MLPLGHASEAGEIAMTSLDAHAMTDDVQGLEFLAQVIGSQVAGTSQGVPTIAMRFGTSAATATRSRTTVYRSARAKRSRVAMVEMI